MLEARPAVRTVAGHPSSLHSSRYIPKGRQKLSRPDRLKVAGRGTSVDGAKARFKIEKLRVSFLRPLSQGPL